MKGILCWVILTRCPHVRVIGVPAPPLFSLKLQMRVRHVFVSFGVGHWQECPTLFLSFFGMKCWWSCQSSMAPCRPPVDGALWCCQGNRLIGLVKWDRKYDSFSACTHSYPSGSGEGSWEAGREAWRKEELEDRQDLYLQCCKLILHFIDALINQCQIFVVVMASLQQLGLAEPGDLIWIFIFWLFPHKMKLIILLFLLWDIDLILTLFLS